MSIESLKVSEATASDIPEMSVILRGLAVATHEVPGEDTRNALVYEHFARKATKLEREMDSDYNKYWVAKASGIVVGMGGYSPHKEQLHSLYVPHKGAGIGSLLFRHIVAQPEISPNYSVWIADINRESFAFFGHQGLERTGNMDVWPLGNSDTHRIFIHQMAPSGEQPGLSTVD